MSRIEQQIESLISLPMPRLVTGRLCLDFVNSLDPRGGPHPVDFLTSYAALVSWGRHTATLTDEQARTLIGASEARSAEAEATFEHAIALRETIHRVFAAIARGQQPPEEDIEALSTTYTAVLTHARIAPTATGYDWTWIDDKGALDRMLWPVTRSAIELLTSAEIGRVKECVSDGCGWLFLDMSKNNSRRWCSMEGCGSRDKMRRQYARKRAK